MTTANRTRASFGLEASVGLRKFSGRDNLRLPRASGGADILVCHRIGERGHSCPPSGFEFVREDKNVLHSRIRWQARMPAPPLLLRRGRKFASARFGPLSLSTGGEGARVGALVPYRKSISGSTYQRRRPFLRSGAVQGEAPESVGVTPRLRGRDVHVGLARRGGEGVHVLV